jgi:hypothetical protein
VLGALQSILDAREKDHKQFNTTLIARKECRHAFELLASMAVPHWSTGFFSFRDAIDQSNVKNYALFISWASIMT